MNINATAKAKRNDGKIEIQNIFKHIFVFEIKRTLRNLYL